MSDEQTSTTPDATERRVRRRRAASRPAGPPPAAPPDQAGGPDAPTGTAPGGSSPAESEAVGTTSRRRTAKAAAEPAAKATAKKTAAKKAEPAKKAAAKKAEPAKKTAAKKTAAKKSAAADAAAAEGSGEQASAPTPDESPAPRRRSRRAAAPAEPADGGEAPSEAPAAAPTARRRSRAAKAAEPAEPARSAEADGGSTAAPLFQAPAALFQPPADEDTKPGTGTRRRGKAAAGGSDAAEETAEQADTDIAGTDTDQADEEGAEQEGTRRRRRRRGGRGRRRSGGDAGGDSGGDATEGEPSAEGEATAAPEAGPTEEAGEDEGGSAGTRRRRRRRRKGSDGDVEPGDDPPNTVVKVREPRSRSGEVTSLKGSTRLEAKKQRRREGREAGRRRVPILTESEFLARRESVDRVMVIRQEGDRTQIAALEDGVLVEHYVTRGGSSSMVGNVYLGKVQNVLPSMEAAFVDIGRGRNAVLYAGEVNWDAAGLEGQPRRIEFALKSGDSVLVQVTKDPIGHKGARLTSQISLPGRYLVYVPDGSMTGISRKLPDTERSRLKGILKRVVPDDAGVIVRTAAEGASEDELARDVGRLAQSWTDISAKATTASAPALLSSEPDLAIKVVRDMFNEDVSRLVVSGDGAWRQVNEYVTSVAPDLEDRLSKWVGPGDVFAEYRIDEQLTKGLDRKVWLPSGGSLVIDRTEAMTVIDVNTGKFTGQGGNLEETVTRNNLEAAEEIVRQLRLRDIGGIIVVDFIDMVLESNRELVLRRLLECLGRDRTKHQVAEVTSLGLVQMTRKRIGQGLLEVFGETCEHCNGRGIRVSLHPVPGSDHGGNGGHGSGGNGSGGNGSGGNGSGASGAPGGSGSGGSAGSGRKRRRGSGVDPADVAARALASRSDGEAGTDGPDDRAAEVDAPEVEAPEAEAPEVEAPEAEAPEVEAPEVEAPEAEAP
ncbi:MAG: Rne/Rng family ribonuclease [Candidatus Nanopelagicales bacterium]